MSGCDCHIKIEHAEQRHTLILLLSINAVMFCIEFAFGLVGQSTGLISDAVDMLADALVYGVGLYAVGKSAEIKIRGAHFSGVFQIVLALGVMADVVRRFIFGSEPESILMMGFGLLALFANVWCLILIAKHRHGEIHMRASWIFSKNDVIANVGVILGGLLVYLLDSHLPDLLIGFAIALIVIRGGIAIIKDAANEKAQIDTEASEKGDATL
jgi:cation diffusion facilitator family transporter